MSEPKDRPFAPENLQRLSDADLRDMLKRPVIHPKIYRPVHEEIARRAAAASDEEKKRREDREIEALGLASQQVDIGWSADRKSTLALWVSCAALVIAAVDAFL